MPQEGVEVRPDTEIARQLKEAIRDVNSLIRELRRKSITVDLKLNEIQNNNFDSISVDITKKL